MYKIKKMHKVERHTANKSKEEIIIIIIRKWLFLLKEKKSLFKFLLPYKKIMGNMAERKEKKEVT